MEAKERRKIQRILFLCTLFFVLLNYPFLSLFNKVELMAGIPVLYAYVIGAWLLFILLTALLTDPPTWLAKRMKRNDNK